MRLYYNPKRITAQRRIRNSTKDQNAQYSTNKTNNASRAKVSLLCPKRGNNYLQLVQFNFHNNSYLCKWQVCGKLDSTFMKKYSENNNIQKYYNHIGYDYRINVIQPQLEVSLCCRTFTRLFMHWEPEIVVFHKDWKRLRKWGIDWTYKD